MQLLPKSHVGEGTCWLLAANAIVLAVIDGCSSGDFSFMTTLNEHSGRVEVSVIIAAENHLPLLNAGTTRTTSDPA